MSFLARFLIGGRFPPPVRLLSQSRHLNLHNLSETSQDAQGVAKQTSFWERTIGCRTSPLTSFLHKPTPIGLRDRQTPLANYRLRKRNSKITSSYQSHEKLMDLPIQDATWHFKKIVVDLKLKRNVPEPDYHFDQVQGSKWQCRLRYSYPHPKEFVGVDSKKKSAEQMACKQALLYVTSLSELRVDLNPIDQSEDDVRTYIKKSRGPIPVQVISNGITEKMQIFLGRYADRLNDQTEQEIEKFSSYWNSKNNYHHLVPGDRIEHVSPQEDDDPMPSNADYVAELNNDRLCNSPQSNVLDMLRGGPYKSISDSTNWRRIEHLKNHLIRLETGDLCLNPRLASINRKREELPIITYKQSIQSALKSNQVIVISGETGCGKTTQVPRILLEEAIREATSPKANFSMLVSQPRRLAAISIAERVATEWGESLVGNTIGYKVRFAEVLPAQSHWSILFCTAGMLLRKMQQNSHLLGVTHVVIDEVHERDVITDFLLILLKRVLANNPEIKLILMSASINSQSFSRFFDNCPVINVPGRQFQVKPYYLDTHLEQYVKYLPSSSRLRGSRSTDKLESDLRDTRNPKLMTDLIAGAIRFIDTHRPPGAILCFLPGWSEISEVKKLLEDDEHNFKSSLLVIPVHSRLPQDKQRLIFEPVSSDDVRKIILATNIAETSLTVDDVKYVVDSGTCKEVYYDSTRDFSTFGLRWISRASAKQRQGRAGRVCEGECYKIYFENVERIAFDEFATPEMRRIPLEQVVIQAKFHCPWEKSDDFLSEALDPPDGRSLSFALANLHDLRVIDENERLTPLGRRIVHFTTDPRLSVSLVTSVFLKCVRPMVLLAAILSSPRDLFRHVLDDTDTIRQIKASYGVQDVSDHLAMINIIERYNRGTLDQNSRQYVSRWAVDVIMALADQYGRQLSEAGLLKQEWEWKKEDSQHNVNAREPELIKATLLKGLFPNIVRVVQGRVSEKGRLDRLSLIPYEIKMDNDVKFGRESIMRDLTKYMSQDLQLAHRLYMYFAAHFSKESRQVLVRDTSSVSTMGVLLFGSAMNKAKSNSLIKVLVPSNSPEDEHAAQSELIETDGIVIESERFALLNLALNMKDAKLVWLWRKQLDTYLYWYSLITGLENELAPYPHVTSNGSAPMETTKNSSNDVDWRSRDTDPPETAGTSSTLNNEAHQANRDYFNLLYRMDESYSAFMRITNFLLSEQSVARHPQIDDLVRHFSTFRR